MPRLLSKKIGKTKIRGDIVPQYVLTSSGALTRILIGQGIEISQSSIDGTIKIGNDLLEINKEAFDKETFERNIQLREKLNAIKPQNCVAATK